MMPPRDFDIGVARRLAQLEKQLAYLQSIVTNPGLSGTTWTPSFSGSTTAGVYTYSIQEGDYVRIGNVVYFTGRLTITAIGTPPVGTMRIAGLPFTSSATMERGTATFGRISQLDFNAADIQLTGFVNANNTNIALETVRDNGASVAYPAATFTNAATDLIFSGFYFV